MFSHRKFCDTYKQIALPPFLSMATVVHYTGLQHNLSGIYMFLLKAEAIARDFIIKL